MEQLVEGNALDRRHARRHGVVIDQHREGNAVVIDERARVLRVAGADDHDFSADRLHLRIFVAQLRGVRTAVQSAEVAQEHERDVAIAPVVAEASRVRVGIHERDVREGT